MSIRLQRNVFLVLLFIVAAALMAQCTTAPSSSRNVNGLICQTDKSSSGGINAGQTEECRLKCPDGRVLSLPGALATEKKDELNFMFCGVPVPTATSVAGSQMGAADFALTPTMAPPLSHLVESCNLETHEIVFSFIYPKPNLDGKQLTVDIQGQPADCSLLPGQADMLSCKFAPHTSFPAGIVVKVNDQTVDFFAFNGGYCYYGQGTKLPAISPVAATPQPIVNATEPPPAPAPRPTKEPKPTHEPRPTKQPKPTKSP